MNFFEFEAAKYERRVKKIRENPDPTLLSSNLLLYESQLDQRKQWLRDWREATKPFAYCISRLRIMEAMGINGMLMDELADRAAGDLARKYFQLARNYGFPDDTCDRVQVLVGMGLSGDIPPPSLAVVEHHECDPVAQGVLYLGRYYRVPTYSIDCPGAVSEITIKYVAQQLRDIIKRIEREVPGAKKFEEAKLIEIQELEKAERAAMDEIIELVKHVPSPVAGRDMLRMPPREMEADPRALQYYLNFRDELRQRTSKGFSPAGEERLRFYWLVSAPFYSDVFRFLAERGVSSVYEEGPGVNLGRRLGMPERYGIQRKLDPMEEEAITAITGHWAGPATRRVSEILSRCKDFSIDGLVHFMLPGCITCNGTAYLVAKKAEEELGIPSLMLEDWCLDEEKHNEADMRAKLEDFIEFCIAAKSNRKK